MKTVAIIGAGIVAAETARQLAALEVARDIRLIDPQSAVAAGKALDIQQAGPIGRFGTRLAGASDLSAGAGAAVFVIADRAGTDDPHPIESGLDLMRRLAGSAPRAPFVFACPGHYELMQLAARELRIEPRRLIGSSPEALAAAARAMLALAAGVSPGEAAVPVCGVPGGWVFGWSEAIVSGRPAPAALPPHEILAVERRARASWPPGPYTLGSAAARVAAAVLVRSRRRFTCFAAIDEGEWRGRIAAMPVLAGPDGLLERLEPALSARERIQLASALSP